MEGRGRGGERREEGRGGEGRGMEGRGGEWRGGESRGGGRRNIGVTTTSMCMHSCHLYTVVCTWNGIDADVNHNGAWFHPIVLNQLRLPYPDYQNVCLGCWKGRGNTVSTYVSVVTTAKYSGIILWTRQQYQLHTHTTTHWKNNSLSVLAISHVQCSFGQFGIISIPHNYAERYTHLLDTLYIHVHVCTCTYSVHA